MVQVGDEKLICFSGIERERGMERERGGREQGRERREREMDRSEGGMITLVCKLNCVKMFQVFSSADGFALKFVRALKGLPAYWVAKLEVPLFEF